MDPDKTLTSISPSLPIPAMTATGAPGAEFKSLKTPTTAALTISTKEVPENSLKL